MAHVANVTISASQVAADLTDFVVYVDLSDLPADFHTTVTSSAGDVRCYKSDGTTELAREVVAYDAATDTGELHIKFSGTLSSSSDTTIQIHADGTSSDYAVTATYGRNNVWSDYAGVWHLQDNTDSTGNGSSLAYSGNATIDSAGKIGSALLSEATGSNDYAISDPSGIPAVTASEPVSLQVWVNRDTDQTSDDFEEVYLTARDDSPVDAFIMGLDGGQVLTLYSSGGNTISRTGGTALGLDTWYKLDIVFDQSASTVDHYVDGANDGQVTSYSDTSALSSGAEIVIGGPQVSSPAGGIDGHVDETRIRYGALSDNWITTEYNNQSSPGTFYTAVEPSAGVDVDVATAAINLTTNAATVDVVGSVEVSANTAAINLATNAATIDTEREVSVGTVSIDLQTHTATIDTAVDVSVNTAAINLATQPATITTTGEVDVNVGSVAINLATQPATISTTGTVDVSAATAAINLATHPATITTTYNVDVGTAALNLTTNAATVETPVNVSADTAAINLTTHQATVAGAATNVNVDVAAITLSTLQATVAATEEFAFPTIAGYSAGWNIDPLDRIYFYQSRTTTDQTVYTSDGKQHSNPIAADRFGNLPSIRTQTADYSIWVANRYGVIKYRATEDGGSWSVGKGFEEITPAAVALSLSTHGATVAVV